MSDWILAFTTMIGAAIYLRATVELPQLLVGDAVGPQFFPALVGCGLLLSGVLLMVEAWRKPATAGQFRFASPQDGARKVQIILAVMTVWTIVYYAAFEPVGYIPSTIVYLFCLLSYFNRTAWWKNALYTLGFTAVSYLIFADFLNVVLPSGILPL